MSLESLSNEIFESIMHLLDCKTIIKCTRVGYFIRSDVSHRLTPATKVSRTIKRKIKSSTYLGYLIELEVSGYVENRCFKGPFQESIDLLAERVRYWKEMNWTERVVYEKPNNQNLSNMVICRRGIILRSTMPEVFRSLPSPNIALQYDVIQPSLRLPDSKVPSIKRITLPRGHKLLDFDPG